MFKQSFLVSNDSLIHLNRYKQLLVPYQKYSSTCRQYSTIHNEICIVRLKESSENTSIIRFLTIIPQRLKTILRYSIFSMTLCLTDIVLLLDSAKLDYNSYITIELPNVKAFLSLLFSFRLQEYPIRCKMQVNPSASINW